jgi:hypothetical protein
MVGARGVAVEGASRARTRKPPEGLFVGGARPQLSGSLAFTLTGQERAMPSTDGWRIPLEQQPSPDDVRYDLDRALSPW